MLRKEVVASDWPPFVLFRGLAWPNGVVFTFCPSSSPSAVRLRHGRGVSVFRLDRRARKPELRLGERFLEPDARGRSVIPLAASPVGRLYRGSIRQRSS